MRFRARRHAGAAGRLPLRRRRPILESLEDRLAPAVVGTLSLSGTSLVYTGKAITDAVTLSTNGNGSQLTIADATGTITSTVSGFKSGATLTGNIPSNMTTITVNLPKGSTRITLGAVTTTRGLS